MGQFTRLLRPRPCAALASFAFALALTTCDQNAAGPGRRAALAVQPVLPAGADLAAFNLTIDNARLIVVRPPADTVFDRTFAFPADQTDLSIQADIPMEQSPETFRVTIELLSGAQVLFTGTQDVQLTEGAGNPPVQLPVTYTGPGQDVASLSIAPLDSVLSFNASLTFRATALDAQGNVVDSFYVAWSTNNPAVPIDATGTITAPALRGSVIVTARTPITQSAPNGISDVTLITFTPIPTAITIVSGCGQSGPPGLPLPQPIVARVVATDGLGVKGVQVQFTAPAGGSVATALVVTDDNGLAQTFATLPSLGPAVFSIGATGLTTVPCNQMVVSATQLAFTPQPPSSLVVGSGFLVVVTAQDAQGNTATSFTGSVSLTLGIHPVGVTPGVATVSAVAGVATFSNFGAFTVAGVYTLVASSAGLSVESAPFTVLPGAPAQLAFTAFPTSLTVPVGTPIGPPAPRVVIQDQFGNVNTTATNLVTIAIGANPGNATLGGIRTRAVIAGVATFPDLTIDQVGTGYTLVAMSTGLASATSAPFDVVPVPGLHLVFTTQPSNVTAGNIIAPAVVVTAQDAQNNPVPSFTGDVTLTLGSCGAGAILLGTTLVPATSGVATFSDLIIEQAGGCILVASSPGLQNVASAGFTVSPGPPAQLAFTTQPSTVAVGGIMPIVGVTIEDALGNPVLTATNEVTLTIGTNPGNATLGGATTNAAVSGVAVFTDLTLNQVGTGYTLVAMSGSLTAATSTPFDVTAGAVTQLAVVVTPPSVTAGTPATITVTAQDVSGATVAGYRGTIRFTSSDPQASLPANYTFTAGDNGVHSFTGGAILRTAGSQSITAMDVVTSSITGTGSATVVAAGAASLAFRVQPSTVTQGAIIAPPVQVAIQDQFGNTVPTRTDLVMMDIGVNPGNATLGGGGPVAASAGIATFNNLTLSAPGSGYTLVASATGLGSVESTPFGVLPAAGGIAWNNPAGGNWSVASNWSPARVPVKGDTVFITLPGTYTVTLNMNDTVAFLTLGGSGAPTLQATSRVFGVDSGATVLVGATLDLASSTLNGAATLTSTLTNQGTLRAQSSAVNIAVANLGLLVARASTTLNRPLTTGPGSTLRVEGDAFCCASFLTVTDGFTNNGTIELTAINSTGTTAQLNVPNGTLVNAAGGVITSTAGAGGAAGARTIQAELDNQGTLTVTQALTLNPSSAAHQNSGTIDVNGGNLTLSQFGTAPSFTTTGTITIAAGDTLEVFGGAFNYSGGLIGGAGALLFSSLTATLTPGLTNDVLGLSIINSTVNGPGTLGNAAGRTLVIQSSTINAPLDNQGIFTTRASSDLNGPVTTGPGSTLRVEGDAFCCASFLTVANGFTNNGTIELRAINSTGTTAQLTVTNGTLVNAPGGAITSSVGAGGARTLTAQLDNRGSLTVAQPLTINKTSAAHTNSGTIDVTADLTLSQSGTTPSFTTTGTITVASGDTLFVSSGAFSYNGGAIGGLGALVFTNASMALTPSFTNDTLSLSFTNATVNGPGTLGNAAGATLVAQNTTFNAPVSNQGLLRARSSTSFNGALTNASGATLRVEGDAFCCSANVTVLNGFTNNGAIELTAINATGTTAQINVTNGTLVNAVGATISSLVGNGGARTLSAQLDNQGTLTVAQPLSLNRVAAAHTNSGAIDLTADLTLFQSGATPSLTTTGTITVASGDTLFVSSGAFNYNSGAIGGLGALVFTNATLTLVPSLTNDTLSLSLTNGTVNGPGTLGNAAGATLFAQNTTFNGPVTNFGVLRARSSTVFSGALTNAPGATLRVEGDAFCCSANVTVATGFTNNGAIELTALNATGTTAQLNVNGTLVNAVGATISSLVGNGGARTLTAALDNRGALIVDQALTINRASSVHTNSGTINLSGGNLTINQSGTSPSFTNTGTITVGTSQVWTVTGGAWTQSAGTVGGGGLVLTSVNPAAFNTGHSFNAITLSSTTASFSTSQSTGATAFTLTNSTVNGPGTFTNLSGQTLVMTNGVMNAALDNQGLLTLRGSPDLNGTFTTAAGSTLLVEGDAFCCSATATVLNGFTNNGTIELTAINATGTTAQLTVTNGTLVNVGTATINVLAGAGGARTLNAAVNNQGTLTINQPLTMSRASSVHTNSGTISISGGNLTINQSGITPSFTNSSTGTINLLSGRTWTVTGGAWTHGGPTLGGATQPTGGALVLSSVNPAAFNTAHTLNAITLTSTTASFTLDQTTATAFTLTNATVNGPGKFTNLLGNTLVMTNGAMNADLDNQGQLTLRGSPDLNGTFTTTSTSTLRVEGDAFCCSATATVLNGFTNNGTIELTAINATGTTAQLTVTNGTLVNAAGHLIDVQAGNGGARTLNAALNNQGTLTVNQTLTMNRTSSVHTNSGTINIAGGDLTINQSGVSPSFSNTGSITVGVGRTWTVTGGAWTHQNPGTLSGNALVLSSVNPAAFNVTHGLSAITLNSTTASFTLNQTTASTAFTFTNSTVNGPGSFTNAAGRTLVMTNGAINAAFDNQGLLRLRGSPDVNGTLTTAAGSTLRVEGDAFCCAATATVLNGFTNNGAIELIAINASGTTAQLSITTGPLTNSALGTIASLAGNGGARTLTAELINQGTMTVAQALTMSYPAASHSNSGLIQLAGGDLTVILSGLRPAFGNTSSGVIDVGTNKLVINNQSSGSFTNAGGGTLRGSGTIDIGTASFITNGTTVVGSSPGLLNFVGPYLQGPDPSILKVEIGGNPTNPGVDFDRLQVSENVTLQGGTLDVTPIAPIAGQTYVIIQVAAGKTISGDFQTKIGLGQCVSGVSGTAYLIVCP